MNLGARGCSELRSHHCTPAWGTKPDYYVPPKNKRLIKIQAEKSHKQKVKRSTIMCYELQKEVKTHIHRKWERLEEYRVIV